VFGIGMQEIVLICVIALIVVGPKRLPEIARALGKGYAEFRRAFDDMKRTVEADLRTDEFRRSLMDLPPPPPPPPAGGPPPPPGESLLGMPAAAPFPYPAQPPEGAAAPEAPPAAGQQPPESERPAQEDHGRG
jgi:sec-independent protein translocase protein TatB